MNTESWNKYKPQLEKAKFGDSIIFRDGDTESESKFIGKMDNWFQYGEAFLLWDHEDKLLVLREEDEKELEYNKRVKGAADKIRHKESLPWYNINKYI